MSVKLRLAGLKRGSGEGGLAEAEMFALCHANTCIPLFWLLPFRHSDVRLQAPTDGAGRYPVLRVEQQLMLQRIEQSIEPLGSLLGARAVRLLLDWYRFLAARDLSAVLLDTSSLWQSFACPEHFILQLQDQFEALERLVDTGHLVEGMQAALLEPSNLLLPGNQGLCLDDVSLSGYGWQAKR